MTKTVSVECTPSCRGLSSGQAGARAARAGVEAGGRGYQGRDYSPGERGHGGASAHRADKLHRAMREANNKAKYHTEKAEKNHEQAALEFRDLTREAANLSLGNVVSHALKAANHTSSAEQSLKKAKEHIEEFEKLKSNM